MWREGVFSPVQTDPTSQYFIFRFPSINLSSYCKKHMWQCSESGLAACGPVYHISAGPGRGAVRRTGAGARVTRSWDQLVVNQARDKRVRPVTSVETEKREERGLSEAERREPPTQGEIMCRSEAMTVISEEWEREDMIMIMISDPEICQGVASRLHLATARQQPRENREKQNETINT